MIGRSIILGRKILLPQNQLVRSSHSHGGIPGEVIINFENEMYKHYIISKKSISSNIPEFTISIEKHLPFNCLVCSFLWIWFGTSILGLKTSA